MMKRKIWFEPKHRKLKRHKLLFYCSKLNAILSGCDLSCKPCPALKYQKEEKNNGK